MQFQPHTWFSWDRLWIHQDDEVTEEERMNYNSWQGFWLSLVMRTDQSFTIRESHQSFVCQKNMHITCCCCSGYVFGWHCTIVPGATESRTSSHMHELSGRGMQLEVRWRNWLGWPKAFATANGIISCLVSGFNSLRHLSEPDTHKLSHGIQAIIVKRLQCAMMITQHKSLPDILLACMITHLHLWQKWCKDLDMTCWE